jgi:SpoIIAA-like
MIEILSGFPDNVVACAAKGQVTKEDYERVLVPSVERALERNAKIRCYYELDAEFKGFDAGAAWEDAKIGLEHLTRWERVAVVTAVQWIRLATNAFRFLMPGQVRVFSPAESAQAKAWITAAS